MKTRILYLFIFILIVSPIAYGSISLGLLGGYCLPSDSLYNEAPYFGGVLTIEIHRNLAFEINAFSNRFDVKGSENGLSEGKIIRIPILLGLKGQFPLKSGRIKLFIVAGGGYSSNTFELAPSLKSSWKNVRMTISESIESGLTLFAGGGFEFILGQNISLVAEVRYLVNKVNGSWSQTDDVTGVSISGSLSALNLNRILSGISFKYIF